MKSNSRSCESSGSHFSSTLNCFSANWQKQICKQLNMICFIADNVHLVLKTTTFSYYMNVHLTLLLETAHEFDKNRV